MNTDHKGTQENKEGSAQTKRAKCKDSTTFYNIDGRFLYADLFKSSSDLKIAVSFSTLA